jgi:peptidyl-dipeptidase Dcp
MNPLLEPWTGPFEAPPFDRFEPRHFRPTFDSALKQVRAEIDSVAADPTPPSFTITIEALECSGRSLDRIARRYHTNWIGAARGWKAR